MYHGPCPRTSGVKGTNPEVINPDTVVFPGDTVQSVRPLEVSRRTDTSVVPDLSSSGSVR